MGFPIRTSPDQSLVSGSPTLFAATHVLLRLLSPRHPSCALAIFHFHESFAKTKAQRGVVNHHANSHINCLPTCAYAVFKERAKSWWSRSGSNRRHPACKAGALPAELRPRHQKGVTMVGLDRFELSTPRLSSVCSNQLSYRPLIQATSAPRLSKNRNDALGPSKPESKLTMLTELRTSTLTWLLPAALRPPIAP